MRVRLVSVVIPCYNQAHFLGEAIESVVAQTYEPIETIVVDDGSTDETSAVAAAHEIRCVRQENRGLSEARNAGFRVSSGEMLLFLDADDLLAPDAIPAGVSCLSNRPDAALVFGRPDVVGLPRRWIPPLVETDHYRHLLERDIIWMPGLVLYRRRILDEVGTFDRRYDGAEDYDLYLRITRRYPIALCPGMHGTYRRHDANMNIDSLRMFRAKSAVLRSHRKYVRSKKDYRRAYREGVKTWRRHYGHWVILDTREQIGTGQIRSALKGLTVLLRYDPQGFASAVLGGLRRAVAVFLGYGTKGRPERPEQTGAPTQRRDRKTPEES
jgi:glycosyltransferase involved in cell wall biosynthesis